MRHTLEDQTVFLSHGTFAAGLFALSDLPTDFEVSTSGVTCPASFEFRTPHAKDRADAPSTIDYAPWPGATEEGKQDV